MLYRATRSRLLGSCGPAAVVAGLVLVLMGPGSSSAAPDVAAAPAARRAPRPA